MIYNTKGYKQKYLYNNQKQKKLIIFMAEEIVDLGSNLGFEVHIHPLALL